MSVKHVEEYYKQICDQYFEMMDNIKEFEQDAVNGLVDPDRIEGMKNQIKPLKDNYERWSYMMFLLHRPQRKSKQTKHEMINKKLLKDLDKKNSLQGVIQENKDCIENMKNERKE